VSAARGLSGLEPFGTNLQIAGMAIAEAIAMPHRGVDHLTLRISKHISLSVTNPDNSRKVAA
jgi:hypothetical protein